MRISDWSSYVCSSDLSQSQHAGTRPAGTSRDDRLPYSQRKVVRRDDLAGIFRQLLECGIDLAGILQAFPEVQGIVEIDVEHDEWCAVHLRGMDDWTCMKRAYAVKHAGRGGTSLDAVITKIGRAHV